jgi:hypothetical protein
MLVVDIEDVVKKALEELKNNQLISDYEKHEQKITEVLKKAAQKETTLTTKIGPMIENKTVLEVEKEMTAIIGYKRVDLIKKSFAIETYRMKVAKTPNGQTTVHVHRRGVEFQPMRWLTTISDIDKSEKLQWASLVIELFFFLFSSANIITDIKKVGMMNIVREVEAHTLVPAFKRELNTFLEAWNKAGVNAWGKAKSIFNILKKTYLLQIGWTFTKVILQNMSTPQTIRAIGEFVLMVVASFATNGIALIARIVLAVNNFVYLEQKIENLGNFSYLKTTMHKLTNIVHF